MASKKGKKASKKPAAKKPAARKPMKKAATKRPAAKAKKPAIAHGLLSCQRGWTIPTLGAIVFQVLCSGGG